MVVKGGKKAPTLEYEASDALDIKAITLLDQTRNGTAAKTLN